MFYKQSAVSKGFLGSSMGLIFMLKIIYLYFLISVLCLAGCQVQGLDQSHRLANGPEIQNLDCFSGWFHFDGGQWQLKELIGEGYFGKVYSLADENGDMVEDMVAKVFYKIDNDPIVKQLSEESLLSQAFPDHYVPTVIAQNFSFKNQFGAVVYAGILVKEKVDGVTLQQLIGQSGSKYLSSKNAIRRAYESLASFKETLAKRMIKNASKQIFMGDLHANNIMYDGQHWYIVDGAAFDSKYELSAHLDHPAYDGREMFNLIQILESSKKPLELELFDALIEVQLGEPLKELSSRYTQAL